MQRSIANMIISDYNALIKPELFRAPYGIHGINHALRVLILSNMIIIKTKVSDSDKKILSLASVYHDIGRVNEFKDYDHGYLSFKKVMFLKLLENYSEEEIFYIQLLIELHALDDEDAIKLIKTYPVDFNRAHLLLCIFKDADGLDRIRLGDLDPEFLRTKVAINLVNFAKSLYQNF